MSRASFLEVYSPLGSGRRCNRVVASRKEFQMRRSSLFVVAVAVIGTSALALAAEPTKEHKIISPDEIKWSAGPAALPPGAESSVLYGDPAKEGLFALRLKLPKGYHIPPHSHPKPEVVTVLSGEAGLGMGETANEAKTEMLK